MLLFPLLLLLLLPLLLSVLSFLFCASFLFFLLTVFDSLLPSVILATPQVNFGCKLRTVTRVGAQ